MTIVIDRPLNGGTQKVYRFPNNYGASVVQHNFSYGGDEGLSELAVLSFSDESNNYELDYDTGITDDVLGYLTEENVQDYLTQIEALEKQ